METPSSHLKVRRSDNVTIVSFVDRKILEELAIQEIGEEINRLVESEPGVRLLLDFSGVDHLSSAALGMLITVNNRVKEQNGLLRLANINKQIFEVFKITRLNKLFSIHATADDALADL
ncbi:MAG: STAS domain-containing protein [Phycisphaerae bacterium]|nr:STAS domain-containing protein [Phycisphaerae bacterium]